MDDAPESPDMKWYIHRRSGRVEAICEHEVGHHNGVHGCDGCCAQMPDEMRTKVSRD